MSFQLCQVSKKEPDKKQTQLLDFENNCNRNVIRLRDKVYDVISADDFMSDFDIYEKISKNGLSVSYECVRQRREELKLLGLIKIGGVKLVSTKRSFKEVSWWKIK